MDLYKDQLVKHLNGGEAFLPVDQMLKNISSEDLGTRPNGLPYSFFEVFYHMWFTQKDILLYCTETGYNAPQWPKDYWSKNPAPKDDAQWDHLKNAFFEDREKLVSLINSQNIELTQTVPSNREHTILREILLVIEHTSYHSGQLLVLLRHLGQYS